MQSTNNSTAVATLRSLILAIIAVVIVAVPSTGCANLKSETSTDLGNLGKPSVYRIEKVEQQNDKGAQITYRTLQDDGRWSKTVENSKVPYTEHFNGQLFVGVKAPKGLITFVFFSEEDSAGCLKDLANSKNRPKTCQRVRAKLFSFIE